MPQFVYTARDEAGAAANGMMSAGSVAEVTAALRQEGKYPVSVRLAAASEVGASREPGKGGVKVSRVEIIGFSMQLAIMVETGVTLAEGLDCVAQQSHKPGMKRLIDDLASHVNGGGDFSAALARHPRSFPRLYVALVKAAEKSGMLSKLLARATAYLRDEQEIVRKVKGALTYPAIMLLFAVTVTIFLLAFVLPKFTTIYASKGAALPVPTKILMAASDAVTGHWPWLLAGSFAGTVLGYCYFTSRGGRRVWHYAQLNLPLIGSMYRKLHLSRGLRMIGTMAGSGVHLVDCVSIANDLCDNTYFKDLWDDVGRKIQSGKQMSEPLSQSDLVPRSIARMIHSGEKSGKLAFVTEQVAGFSESELKETIADLTRYIEPLMIIIMGCIIGGVALALMLPIFTISRVVAH